MSERCNNAFDNDPERAREAGRKSKRKPFDVRIKEWIESKIEEGSDKTRDELLREKLYEMAMSGDRQAINDLLNRVYGLPKQKIEDVTEAKTPIADAIKSLIKIKKDKDEEDA